MFAENLINKEIPYLKLEDTGDKALELMEIYKISHLPIINDKNELEGIVSETEIYDFNLEDVKFKDSGKFFSQYYTEKDSHIFDILQLFKTHKTTIVPVIDKNKKYLGTITPLSIIKYLSQLPSVNPQTIGILIETEDKNYSITQISTIIESNSSELLAFIKEDNKILIKVKTNDIESLSNAFERFGYKITLFNVEKTKYDDLYKERFENLLNYLNI